MWVANCLLCRIAGWARVKVKGGRQGGGTSLPAACRLPPAIPRPICHLVPPLLSRGCLFRTRRVAPCRLPAGLLLTVWTPAESSRRVYPNQANNTIPTSITSTSSIRQLGIPSSGASRVQDEPRSGRRLLTISSHHTSPLDCNLITHHGPAGCVRCLVCVHVNARIRSPEKILFTELRSYGALPRYP